MRTETMAAVLLTGHGGLDKLQYREDVPVPTPGPEDVLIRVSAAGINNTDINTRTAWYSKSVATGTDAGAEQGFGEIADADGSWSGTPLNFPRIQGADVCGHIVEVGGHVSPTRIGERVIVATLQGVPGATPYQSITFGSECDGGFAQYTVARSAESYRVACDWSDAELASIPCAYSTAENLLHRARLGAGETVLITGASGGVGSAAVQLARRRGARVIAVAGRAKAEAVRALGADRVLPREVDLLAEPGRESVQVVVDLVAGNGWPTLLEVLCRGGRYTTAGAIAGPLVNLDLRTLYLKDLSLLGCTWQPREVFHNLVSYIERGEIRPLVARTYPLAEIRQAQRDFLEKGFVGKLVLIPPQD